MLYIFSCTLPPNAMSRKISRISQLYPTNTLGVSEFLIHYVDHSCVLAVIRSNMRVGLSPKSLLLVGLTLNIFMLFVFPFYFHRVTTNSLFFYILSPRNHHSYTTLVETSIFFIFLCLQIVFLEILVSHPVKPICSATMLKFLKLKWAPPLSFGVIVKMSIDFSKVKSVTGPNKLKGFYLILKDYSLF